MILNGIIALILRFSPYSIALLADYVTVVKARLTISVKYCLWVPVFHFWPKLMYPAARSLCDSWASYLILVSFWCSLISKLIPCVTFYVITLVSSLFKIYSIFFRFFVNRGLKQVFESHIQKRSDLREVSLVNFKRFFITWCCAAFSLFWVIHCNNLKVVY